MAEPKKKATKKAPVPKPIKAEVEEPETELEEVIDDGEINGAPLEVTKETLGEILSKQEEDDIKREAIKAETKKHENGKNVWRLISKVYNNTLGWEHTTMAMAIGTRGVIVHVKEAIDQKVNATSVYIDNGRLEEDSNGNWFIK